MATQTIDDLYEDGYHPSDHRVVLDEPVQTGGLVLWLALFWVGVFALGVGCLALAVLIAMGGAA